MHLQSRGETHGSVNQAGTLPAPFPVGWRPRWLGSECRSQRLPRSPSPYRPAGSVELGSGQWGQTVSIPRQIHSSSRVQVTDSHAHPAETMSSFYTPVCSTHLHGNIDFIKGV